MYRQLQPEKMAKAKWLARLTRLTNMKTRNRFLSQFFRCCIKLIHEIFVGSTSSSTWYRHFLTWWHRCRFLYHLIFLHLRGLDRGWMRRSRLSRWWSFTRRHRCPYRCWHRLCHSRWTYSKGITHTMSPNQSQANVATQNISTTKLQNHSSTTLCAKTRSLNPKRFSRWLSSSSAEKDSTEEADLASPFALSIMHRIHAK